MSKMLKRIALEVLKDGDVHSDLGIRRDRNFTELGWGHDQLMLDLKNRLKAWKLRVYDTHT